MNFHPRYFLITSLLLCGPVSALSMAPEEFLASRQMACVLAEQSLGNLSEEEYGSRTHNVLDGFEGDERSTILAKALGYYDGLMFDISENDVGQINRRLELFIGSNACQGSYQDVVFQL